MSEHTSPASMNDPLFWVKVGEGEATNVTVVERYFHLSSLVFFFTKTIGKKQRKKFGWFDSCRSWYLHSSTPNNKPPLEEKRADELTK